MCLTVCFFLFCVLWIFPVMRLFCFWFVLNFFSVFISYGKTAVISFSVISIILDRQFSDRQSLYISFLFNPFSANFTKWPNTLKQFVGNLPTNCLSVFDHFVGLMLKELIVSSFLLLIWLHRMKLEKEKINWIAYHCFLKCKSIEKQSPGGVL